MLYNEHNTCTLHRGSAARDGGHDGHGIRAHIIPMRTLGIWQNFILRFSEYIFRNGATDDNSTPYAVEGWLFCCYTLFFSPLYSLFLSFVFVALLQLSGYCRRRHLSRKQSTNIVFGQCVYVCYAHITL